MKPLLIILGLCLLFSLILSLVVVDGDNPLTRFDHDAVTTLHDHTTTIGTDIFELVTWFGSPGTWVVAISSMAYLIGRTRWADLLTGAAMIGGGKLLNVVLKDLFDRPRPVFATESSAAFPSGHAMMALLTYGFLAFLLWTAIRRRPARAVMVAGTAVLVGLIGLSRIYLGAHYPTDILGGYAMGGAWLSLCLLGKIGAESRRARLAKLVRS